MRPVLKRYPVYKTLVVLHGYLMKKLDAIEWPTHQDRWYCIADYLNKSWKLNDIFLTSKDNMGLFDKQARPK